MLSNIRPVKITDGMNGLKIGPTGEFLQDAPNAKTSNWACNRADCLRCIKKDCIWRPRTNADRIRAMSDEEMADYFSRLSCWPNAGREDCRGMANCMECWIDWLREEATE